MTFKTIRAAMMVGMVGLLATSGDTYAGPGHAEEAATPAKKDPYAIPEMKLTKIPDFDSFFASGKSPIESLILTRKRVDMAQGRINTSLGLAASITFAESVAEFKKRVETKGKLALKKGKLPRFTTADAVPDDVQKSIDEFNAALTEMEAALTQLESIKGELTTLATKATELPTQAADAAKSAGLNPMDSATAVKNTGANVKILSTSKDESEKLYTSLTSMTGDLEAQFGAAID